MTTLPAPTTLSTQLAQTATSERLLNSFLREVGIADPRGQLHEPPLATLPQALRLELLADGDPVCIELACSRGVIVGTMRRWSPSGHHRYGERLWRWRSSAGRAEPIESALELAELLLAELAARALPSDGVDEAARELLAHIHNSVEKTTRYAAHALRRDQVAEREASDPFLAAEQSVIFGHPFHPTPKSSEGFTQQDIERYAPELGASLSLRYLALSPAIAREEWLTSAQQPLLPALVERVARQALPARARDWPLLPCHPWQAEHLLQLRDVQALIEQGLLVNLAALGAPVFPTSSVRTVYLPGHQLFFKLPLNVRITNLVRVNPPEQLRRCIDASRVLAALQQPGGEPDFQLLREVGYRTVSYAGWDSDRQDDLAGRFGVLFRECPAWWRQEAPRVLSALLETPPGASAAHISGELRRAGLAPGLRTDWALVEQWLRRYLAITLLPALRLFVREGVSLEAHVQNTLISFARGWPYRCYIRDLEGTSVSRERAIQRPWFAGRVAQDSPLLYADADAWLRLKYYLLVNHLGHLFAVLADCLACDERRLWKVTRQCLQEEARCLSPTGGVNYIEELLDGPTLPAKANFLSRLQQRGERPLYVSLANPLATL